MSVTQTEDVVLITGGGGEIGLATALRLGGRGHPVAIADADGGAADRAASAVRHLGGRALALQTDVSDEEGVRAAYQRVARELGPVVYLVNNAAIASHCSPGDLTLAEWNRVLSVDLTGYFLCSRELYRTLPPGREGSAIVNVGSIAGVSALGRGNLAYSVAKAGVGQLTRELAVEWARRGIRVNSVLPAQVNTAPLRALLGSQQSSGEAARMLAAIPLGRLVEPDDVAAAISFLLSPEASMITGSELPVDGGNLALNPGGTLGAP